MKCPDCGLPIVAVCGFHAPDAPAGHQPKSFGTPGEHYITSHRCGGRVHVGDSTCRTVGVGATLDEACLSIGGYWR